MKKNSIALYLLMCSTLGLMAQTYVAPPALLPNPAHSVNNSPYQESVYAPGTYSNPNNAVALNNGTQTHLVKKGESLYRIAKLYNVTVDDIKAWNYLQSDLIAVGANLSIGAPAPYVASNNVPAQYDQMTERAVPGWLTGSQNHTILAGESLSAIANYYGLTEARLRSMNNLGPQDPVPAGFVLNVNPCFTGTALTNNVPAPYDQSNNAGSYPSGNTQDYNSPVPKYTPQNRFATNNAYPSNNATNYGYRPEDQFDPNATNASAIPNNYDYTTAKSVVPNNQGTFTQGTLIYENGRRVHVAGSFDTLEIIADQYQISPERLRAINRMGANNIVYQNQKIQLE